VPEVEAVIANQDINASVRLTPDMFVVRKTPQSPLLPPDVCGNLDIVKGRVSRKFIPQGAVLAESMIAEEGAEVGLSGRIPDGFRAYAVKIGEASGVGYLLRPGCYVDVIVVMDIKKPGRKTETVSNILLQRVKVAAVGQMLHDETDKTGAKRVRSVTLIVAEQDIPKLHLAETKGRLALAMRSTSDDVISEGAQAHEKELFGEAESESQPTPSGMLAVTGPPVAEEPEEAAPPPATVTVVNNTRGKSSNVFRLMFKDAMSMSILGIQQGLSKGDTGATYAPPTAGSAQGSLPPGLARRSTLTERERRLRRAGAATEGDNPDRSQESDWESAEFGPAYEEARE
jgi:pilus assembly protein CpaB